MQQYWRGVKISDIKHISKGGGSFQENNTYTYFHIILKDGTKNTFTFNDTSAEKYRVEVQKLFNEYNEVPETYLLENEMHVRINGEVLLFGCRTEDSLGKSHNLTKLEIEELRKQGKIRDEGWRHLAYIEALKIQDNKLIGGKLTVPYIQQLKEIGYDVNNLIS